MGREQSLLDRLAAPPAAARGRVAATAGEDPEAIMESVHRNLRRLFNARHGMSEAQPDYGLPAFTEMVIGAGDPVTVVQEAIRAAIERFEPRLQRVRVSRVIDGEPDRRTLAFRIDGVLVGREGEHRVWYQTALSGNGQFEVTD